jgi:hypothetical protein
MTNTDARTALTRVPSGPAATLLGVNQATLRAWQKTGRIKGTRTASGRWLWDVAAYMEKDGEKPKGRGKRAAGDAPRRS